MRIIFAGARMSAAMEFPNRSGLGITRVADRPAFEFAGRPTEQAQQRAEVVRQLRSDGFSLAAIAEATGLSHSGLDAIIRRHQIPVPVGRAVHVGRGPEPVTTIGLTEKFQIVARLSTAGATNVWRYAAPYSRAAISKGRDAGRIVTGQMRLDSGELVLMTKVAR